MAIKVEGEQYYGIDGQLLEIKRQLRQENGYPFNPEDLKRHLQKAIEGRFKKGWCEKDGVIYFEVTSDGTTGKDWITRLERKNFRVSDSAQSVLRSSDFKPTDGVTYEIAVLKDMLFSDRDRITKKIRAEADKRNLTKPNAEVACLIREKFCDDDLEAMGLLWIVTMHEPINNFEGYPHLLSAYQSVNNSGGFDASRGNPYVRWGLSGFAFVV